MKIARLSLIVSIAILVSCTGSKELNDPVDNTLTIINPTIQEFIPGQKDVKRYSIFSCQQQISNANLKLDSVYYSAFRAPIELIKNDSSVRYEARFTLSPEEAIYKAPMPILTNEAVISFHNQHKHSFLLKVSDIVTLDPIYMP